MHKAFKFGLCPTSEQAGALNQCFGSVRYVYNWALAERKKAYEESGQRLSGVDQMKLIAIAEVGWDAFRTMLEYKCEWSGKNCIIIDRFYPSSKTCNGCKATVAKLPLHVREWGCPSCGAVHDRDHNAAKNIKDQGLALLLQKSTAGDTAGRVKCTRPD